MDESSDYDNLLRSVFDSCDKDGNGFLSSNEFRELCGQLCLEDEEILLKRILFKKECSHLEYNKFRDVLLLLLAGNLTEDYVAENNLNEAFEVSTPKKLEKNQENLNFHENDWSLYGPNSLHNERNSLSTDSGREWLLIDFQSDIDDNSPRNFSQASSLTNHAGNGAQAKQSNTESPILDMEIPEKLTADVIKRPESCRKNANDISSNFFSTTVVLEEITGEGDGEWTSPNTNALFLPFSETPISAMDASEIQSASQAQEALASVWIEIIGDFNSRINVLQLQNLFEALALSSSSQDVERLFEMLDEDQDGFVSFQDFTRKMSVFLQPDLDTDDAEPNKILETKDFDPTENIYPPVLPENQSSTILFSPEEMSLSKFDESVETNENNTSTSYSANTSSAHDASTDNTSSDHNSSPRFCSSMTLAIKNNGISSEASPTSNLTPNFTPNPTPDLDEEDMMKRYHGAPSYRKKRRSSQMSLRRRRGFSSRLTSLPHYHPIKRQSVEDSPLYFLSDERDRFVTNERLREILSHEGLEDSDQIFEDLGIGKDDSFSIEVLSESLEDELKDNPVHHAICAIYKSGICYYRSQRDQHLSEKRKLESTSKHLDHLVEEQEDRIDKIESEYKERVEAVENRFKNKFSRLKLKLETDRGQIEMRNQDEVKQLKQRIHSLLKSESELQKRLSRQEEEKLELEQNCEKLQGELELSKRQSISLQTNINELRNLSMKFGQNHREQALKIEKMLEEYKDESRRLQNKNDDLITRLTGIKDDWGCFDSQKKGNENKTETFGTVASKSDQHSSPPNPVTPDTEVPKITPQKFVNTISIFPAAIGTRSSNHYSSTFPPSSKPSFSIRSRSSMAVPTHLGSPKLHAPENQTL